MSNKNHPYAFFSAAKEQPDEQNMLRLGGVGGGVDKQDMHSVLYLSHFEDNTSKCF